MDQFLEAAIRMIFVLEMKETKIFVTATYKIIKINDNNCLRSLMIYFRAIIYAFRSAATERFAGMRSFAPH
jgi:hypothetical protein